MLATEIGVEMEGIAMNRREIHSISAVVVWMGLSAAAVLASPIKVSPAQPTNQDTVRVTVSGSFPSVCWNFVGAATCQAGQPDTIVIQVPVIFCNSVYQCRCADEPGGYSRVCTFALLAAGNYVVAFTEVHSVPFDPLPTVQAFAQFTVSNSTPTVRRSWGALKASYR